MRRTRPVLAAALLAAVASLTLASPARAAIPTGEYVALGDSYASGVGAAPYDAASGACKRSPDSYPRSLARVFPKLTLKDMTCSGATVADVRSKQLGPLSAKTALVTITVGGNDADFTGTATACLTGTDDDCVEAAFGSAWSSRLVIPSRLQELYTEVRKRAPNAKVVVTGYPRLIDVGTGSCGAITPNAKKREWINYAAEQATEGASGAAAKAGVTFIDIRPGFKGHEACSAKPWINGVDPARFSEIFHPDRTGHGVYTYMLGSLI